MKKDEFAQSKRGGNIKQTKRGSEIEGKQRKRYNRTTVSQGNFPRMSGHSEEISQKHRFAMNGN